MSVPLSALKEAIKEVLREESKDNPHLSREDIIKSNVQIVCEDGDCYQGVVKKAKETFPYRCADCGLPLPASMIGKNTPSCPNCGSEDAEEIERE